MNTKTSNQENTVTTGKQLTVHNASVTTATIEVKTLTIGARQVTQGIFKQLIEEPLIAEDGTLNGVPWGHVTWHPDGCANYGNHWHIVWQYGEELRRSTVFKKPDFGDIESREADAYLAMWISGYARGRFSSAPLKKEFNVDSQQVAYPDGRRINDPVSREVGVKAWANATQAGVRVLEQHADVLRAERAVIQPVSYADYSFRDFSGPLADHEEDRALLEKASQAGYTIAPDADMASVAVTPHGDDSLVDDLRKSESEILDILSTRRKSALEALAKERMRLAEHLAALDAELDAAGSERWAARWSEVSATFKAAVRAEAVRQQRHQDVRETLSQLPQLFIGG